MANPRLDRLKQQLASLMAIFKGSMKKSIEQMDEWMDIMEMMEKNIDGFL
jgi:hypothetical protein